MADKKKKEVVHKPKYTVDITVRVYPKFEYGKGKRFELATGGEYDVLQYLQVGRAIQTAVSEGLLEVHTKWMAGEYDEEDDD